MSSHNDFHRDGTRLRVRFLPPRSARLFDEIRYFRHSDAREMGFGSFNGGEYGEHKVYIRFVEIKSKMLDGFLIGQHDLTVVFVS